MAKKKTKIETLDKVFFSQEQQTRNTNRYLQVNTEQLLDKINELVVTVNKLTKNVKEIKSGRQAN